MAGNFLTKSRHGTIYYFRRRVPTPVQHVIGCSVLMRSLDTGERRLALIRSRALAAQTDAIFQQIIMAKKSSKTGGIKADFTLKLDFNEHGKPSSITVNAQPEEQEAVNSAIQTALEGIAMRVPSVSKLKPQKRFLEAVQEFYAKSQFKPSTLQTFRARLRHAQEHFGADKDVLEIQQSDFSAYCNHVLETVKHPSTQNLYMSSVAQFINWHGKRELNSTLVTAATLALTHFEVPPGFLDTFTY